MKKIVFGMTALTFGRACSCSTKLMQASFCSRLTATLMAMMMMTMSANAKTQDWGGRVIDEKGEPMPFVNVVLLSLPDSAFVQGGMTDEQGVFKIVTDVNEGLFKVTSVGYQTLYIKAGQDLTIQMREDTQLLQEVVVKGQLRSDFACGCCSESWCTLCSIDQGRGTHYAEKGSGRGY